MPRHQCNSPPAQTPPTSAALIVFASRRSRRPRPHPAHAQPPQQQRQKERRYTNQSAASRPARYAPTTPRPVMRRYRPVTIPWPPTVSNDGSVGVYSPAPAAAVQHTTSPSINPRISFSRRLRVGWETSLRGLHLGSLQARRTRGLIRTARTTSQAAVRSSKLRARIYTRAPSIIQTETRPLHKCRKTPGYRIRMQTHWALPRIYYLQIHRRAEPSLGGPSELRIWQGSGVFAISPACRRRKENR